MKKLDILLWILTGFMAGNIALILLATWVRWLDH